MERIAEAVNAYMGARNNNFPNKDYCRLIDTLTIEELAEYSKQTATLIYVDLAQTKRGPLSVRKAE